MLLLNHHKPHVALRFKACSICFTSQSEFEGLRADCRHTGLKITDAEDFLRILAEIMVVVGSRLPVSTGVWCG